MTRLKVLYQLPAAGNLLHYLCVLCTTWVCDVPFKMVQNSQTAWLTASRNIWDAQSIQTL